MISDVLASCQYPLQIRNHKSAITNLADRGCLFHFTLFHITNGQGWLFFEAIV